MDYFIILEDILLTKLPKEKFIKFDKFYKLFLENKLIFDHTINNFPYSDSESVVDKNDISVTERVMRVVL